METKEVQKRRSTARGRKKCETNLKAKPMNAIESRTAQGMFDFGIECIREKIVQALE